MGRPKNNDYPLFMFPDGDRGGFMIRNPITGKRKRYTAEQEALARETAQMLAAWVEKQRQKELLDAGRPKIKELTKRWRAEVLPHQPWDASTRETAEFRLARIDREMGDDVIDDKDVTALKAWLAKTAKRADPYNKWRYILVLLWRFAVSEKLAKINDAEKIEQRSTSRKIESNRKVRLPLDVQDYKDIYAVAEPLLQLAMDLSLVTLQARNEVCHIKHPDFRDGYLYIIRDKTAGDSAMAFIRIRATQELETLKARALALDNIVCPFLIHRKPDRMQRRWLKGKEHWAQVNPAYITRLFAEARDKVERFAALPEKQRPVFHEIRGLGSRLQKELGRSTTEVQKLMAHSDPKTTQIYLERGPQALRDEHFVPVSAPFTLAELLGRSPGGA